MPNGSFTLERTLILPRGKYDPLTFDTASLKGAPIFIKMGRRPSIFDIPAPAQVVEENPIEGDNSTLGPGSYGPKTGPLVVGHIRDAFENPREGVYADIMISSTIEVEVDADGKIVVFLNPGP